MTYIRQLSAHLTELWNHADPPTQKVARTELRRSTKRRAKEGCYARWEIHSGSGEVLEVGE